MLWDCRTFSPSKLLFGHENVVTTVLAMPFHTLASGSLDGSICVWDPNQLKPSSGMTRMRQVLSASRLVTKMDRQAASSSHKPSASESSSASSSSNDKYRSSSKPAMFTNREDTDTDSSDKTGFTSSTMLMPSPHSQSLDSISIDVSSGDLRGLDMHNPSRLIDSVDIPLLQPYCVLTCEKKIRVTCLAMTAQSELFSGHADGAIREWQIATGECLQVMDTKHQGGVSDLCLAPSGKVMYSCGNDGVLYAWDVHSLPRRILWSISHQSWGKALKLHCQYDTLVCSFENGPLLGVDPVTQSEFTMGTHPCNPTISRGCCMAAESGHLHLFDLLAKRKKGDQLNPSSRLESLPKHGPYSISSHGPHVALVSADGELRVWNYILKSWDDSSLEDECVRASVTGRADFHNFRLTRNNTRVIASALLWMEANGYGVTHLNLSKNLLGTGIMYMAEALPRLKSLRHLDIRENSVVVNELLALETALTRSPHLRRLVVVDKDTKGKQMCDHIGLGLDMSGSDNGEDVLRRLNALLRENDRLYSCLLTGKTELRFRHRRLATVPDIVLRARHLEKLELSHNKLTEIPRSIGKMSHIRVLVLHHNKLSTLPPELGLMQSLVRLDISHNNFSTIPNCVTLAPIVELNLERNNLETLPVILGAMKSLKILYLDGNPLSKCKHVPSEVMKKGDTAILHYLKESAEDSSEFRRCRLMLLGNCNVGKTRLRKLLCHNRSTKGVKKMEKRSMNEHNNTSEDDGSTHGSTNQKVFDALENEPNVSTDGIDRELWEIRSSKRHSVTLTKKRSSISDFSSMVKKRPPSRNSFTLDGSGGVSTTGSSGSIASLLSKTSPDENNNVLVDIWDFAGQEVYYVTHQFFLSSRAIYVVVFNLSRPLREGRIGYWLKSILNAAPDATIGLLGTHLDMKMCTPAYVEEYWRKIEQKYPGMMSRVRFRVATSLTTGKNFLRAKSTIASTIMAQPFLKDLIPRKFLLVQSKIDAMRATTMLPTIGLDDFCDILASVGIYGERIRPATDFLHNLGVIFFFPRVAKLRDIVFLDSQWLSNVFATLFTSKPNFVHRGVLKHRHLDQIWRPPLYPSNMHRQLLALLELFELAIPLPNLHGHTYFPALLPAEPPSESKMQVMWKGVTADSEVLQIHFGMDLLPTGFFNKLAVRLLLSGVFEWDPRYNWRDGMMVSVPYNNRDHPTHHTRTLDQSTESSRSASVSERTVGSVSAGGTVGAQESTSGSTGSPGRPSASIDSVYSAIGSVGPGSDSSGKGTETAETASSALSTSRSSRKGRHKGKKEKKRRGGDKKSKGERKRDRKSSTSSRNSNRNSHRISHSHRSLESAESSSEGPSSKSLRQVIEAAKKNALQVNPDPGTLAVDNSGVDLALHAGLIGAAIKSVSSAESVLDIGTSELASLRAAVTGLSMNAGNLRLNNPSHLSNSGGPRSMKDIQSTEPAPPSPAFIKPSNLPSSSRKTAHESERTTSTDDSLPPSWGDSPAFRALLLVHRDQQRLEVVCVAPSSARMYAPAQKLLLTIEDLLIECGIMDVRRFVSCRHCVMCGNDDPVVFPVEGNIVSVLDGDKAAAEAEADSIPSPEHSPPSARHASRLSTSALRRSPSPQSTRQWSGGSRSGSVIRSGTPLRDSRQGYSQRPSTPEEPVGVLRRPPQDYLCENMTEGFCIHLSTMFRPKARLEVSRIEVVNLPQPQLFGMVSISPNPYVVLTVSTAVKETAVRTNTESATWTYEEPLRFQLQPGAEQLLEIHVWSRHTMVNDVRLAKFVRRLSPSEIVGQEGSKPLLIDEWLPAARNFFPTRQSQEPVRLRVVLRYQPSTASAYSSISTLPRTLRSNSVADRGQSTLVAVTSSANLVPRLRTPPKKRTAPSLASASHTVSTVEATKRFITDYYWNLVSYLAARRQRQADFERHLKSLNVCGDELSRLREEHRQLETNFLRKRRVRSTLADFVVLAQIGSGGFGKVYLCQKRDTGEVLALKRMHKKILQQKNKSNHIRNERDVMASTNSDWLVPLIYSFQTESYLYLAMEYLPGGDLWALLNDVGCLREVDACFYMAEMIVCVGELHRLGYIHRDLKPENFLFDRAGHLKLGDFGLSKHGLQVQRDTLTKAIQKQAMTQRRPSGGSREETYSQFPGGGPRKRAYTRVGTPAYMAVEILGNEGYSFSCDWWSLGCIFYEMLDGYAPFGMDDSEAIWNNVKNYRNTLKRPVDPPISDEAWSLIRGLLVAPDQRLGSKDLSDFREHPFFAALDFDTLREQRPPFVPELESSADTRYFEDASFDFAPLDQEDDLPPSVLAAIAATNAAPQLQHSDDEDQRCDGQGCTSRSSNRLEYTEAQSSDKRNDLRTKSRSTADKDAAAHSIATTPRGKKTVNAASQRRGTARPKKFVGFSFTRLEQSEAHMRASLSTLFPSGE